MGLQLEVTNCAFDTFSITPNQSIKIILSTKNFQSSSGFYFVREQSMNLISLNEKDRSRCYARSLTPLDTFWPIYHAGLIIQLCWSDWVMGSDCMLSRAQCAVWWLALSTQQAEAPWMNMVSLCAVVMQCTILCSSFSIIVITVLLISTSVQTTSISVLNFVAEPLTFSYMIIFN